MKICRRVLEDEVEETDGRALAVKYGGVEQLSHSQGLKHPTSKPPWTLSLYDTISSSSRPEAPNRALVFKQIPTKF